MADRGRVIAMMARRRARGGDGAFVVPGYEGLEEIGRGATATVYRAWQSNFRRQVALKVIATDVDRKVQHRFERECALTGQLSGHPHVITVHDSGTAGRRPYLAMAYFERGSLAHALTERGPLPTDEVLRLAVKLSGALETAHRAGILHRDIKPQNVLVSQYGEPALADFGIATIVAPDMTMTAALTPVHAAPELLEGDAPTVAADVYALGSTIFTLLAGAPPYAGPPGEGVLPQLMRIMASDLPPLTREDVAPSTVAILRRAMAKEPSGRHPSAEALGRALQAEQAALGLSVTEMTLAAQPVAPDTGGGVTTAVPSPPGPPTVAPPEDDAVTLDSDRRPPPPPRTDAPPARPEVPWTPVAPLVPADPVAPQADPAGRTLGTVDAPTAIGRPAPAPVAPPARRRRKWPLAVAGVAVVAVVAAAAGWSTTRTHRHHAAPRTTPVASGPHVSPTTAPAPTTTVPTAALTAGKAPTAVSAAATGSSVSLTWTDNTKGNDPQLVFTYPTPPGRLPQPVDRGTTHTLIVGLTPGSGYCFEVVAVVALPSGSSGGAVTAPSTPACVNGAQPSTAPAP